MMMTCTKCQQTKPNDEFGERVDRSVGRQRQCKVCRRAQQTGRGQRAKRRVFEHYGPFCRCCGETELVFLTLDHVDGNGAEHRRLVGAQSPSGRWTAGDKMYFWAIRNNFPSIFQVLCFNCNWAKSHGGCPHERTLAAAI